MTIARGFVITILSGLFFGLLGGAVGFGLGAFAPDYYRVVFRIPASVELDPARLGFGLGITQGLATGVVVGLVVVLAVAWYESRVGERSGE